MPARVVSIRQSYKLNYEYLQKGLEANRIKFQGGVENNNENFDFEKQRTYDFVRTAMATIRDDMTEYLTDILPGIGENAKQDIRSAFEELFTYNAYKKRLENPGQQVGKILKLFIFKPSSFGDEENPDDYVAHINFSCNTIKGRGDEYTVSTSITCQRYTWFEYQEEEEEDLEDVLHGLNNVHLDDD